jgi:pyruvate kinase
MGTRWVNVPKRRRTKLVATLQLDLVDEESIGRYIQAGVNLVRIDVRAGDRDRVQQAYAALRTAAHNARNPIGVIADLGTIVLDEERRAELAFLSELGVDYVAVAHGADAADISEVREALPEGGTQTVLAHITTAAALQAAEDLIESADGLIIDVDPDGTRGAGPPPAGGDDRIAPEDLPVVQRHLLALARGRGRPCIVTTAPLVAASVTGIATSAEVSDVATAVLAGADAVMLGAEPTIDGTVEALQVADRVARRLEADLVERDEGSSVVRAADQAVVAAAVQLARDLDAGAIVVQPSEQSGLIARALSAERPDVPIVGLALSLPAMLQQSMLWGVIPRWVRPDELGDADALATMVATQLDVGGPSGRIISIEGVGAPDAETPPRVTVLAV